VIFLVQLTAPFRVLLSKLLYNQIMLLKVVSYNLHKGRTVYGSQLEFEGLKDLLSRESFDIALVQEVLGNHNDNTDYKHQMEKLADMKWHEYAFAKNSVVSNFDHGNSILSKFPILEEKILDLTLHKREKRSMILTTIDLGFTHLTCLCTHLNLLHKHRLLQAKMILEFLKEHVDPTSPVIFGGDFNDWDGSLTKLLIDEGGFSPPGTNLSNKTFPSFFPLLSLDKILIKNMTFIESSIGEVKHYKKYSDHLPLFYTVDIPS
jgi:endonuclease/exonuclease/phosphatase family metal-dependent hydrolase